MTTEPVAEPTLAELLTDELRRRAWAWDASRSRSQQTAIGASEVGHPCDRFLYYKASGAPEGERSDSWLATVGTAVHTVLAESRANSPDWIVDTKLDIAPGLPGTGDAFHIPTKTVLDDKVLGTTSHREVRLRGAKPQYRAQLHLYGLGYVNLGYEVEYVALAAWPRSNFLTGTNGLYVWTEPYDEQVVERALQRWYRIVEAAPVITANPALVAHLATADGPCSFCPFRDAEKARTNPAAACAGDPATNDANYAAAVKSATKGLIA